MPSTLSGAELVDRRAAGSACAATHGPIGSITFGGPAIPEWFDDTLRSIVGEES